MQHRVQAGLASRLMQLMWHLCDGSLHSGRSATTPPSALRLLGGGFSRSRQSLPTIAIIEARMSVENVLVMLFLVRTRIETVVVAAVTCSCVALAALQTSRTHVHATICTGASFRGTMLLLWRRIGWSGLVRVFTGPKRRPRTARQKQQPAALVICSKISPK